MKEDNLTPNLVVYNTMINIYSRVLDSSKVEELLQRIEESGLAPDDMTYAPISRMYFKLGNPTRANFFYSLIKNPREKEDFLPEYQLDDDFYTMHDSEIYS